MLHIINIPEYIFSIRTRSNGNEIRRSIQVEQKGLAFSFPKNKGEGVFK